MKRISRRTFLQSASAAAAAGMIGCQTTRKQFAAEARRRGYNVLFIMSDQHNAHALGCYGNAEVQTPNLDRLADQGVRFDNAFCQTGQCCPSRYTIWTGRYAHSHGCRWNHVIEPLDETTVGEIFRDAGYATATIGKHHMQYDVDLHGFDHVVSIPEYNAFVTAEDTPHCWAAGDWLPVGQANFSGPVGASHADNDHHMAGFWANETIKFMRTNQERPFCAWLSFHGPHVPHVASKPWMDLYDADSLTLPPNFHDAREEVPTQLRGLRGLMGDLNEQQFRDVLKCYYALVSQIDHNIGRVLDELKQLGLADRTIVVYTADHGEMMAEHGSFRKAVLNYDATVRVPMIVRAPGVVRPGRVNSELVGLIDLLPTLCDLTGLEYPDAVQGSSLVPLLRQRPTAWRDVIFSEIGYPRPEFPLGLCTMARTKEFKYIHHDNHGDPMEEFFDLRDDPWETVNLASDPRHVDRRAQLKAAIKHWRETTDHAPLYPIEKEFKQGRRP